MSTYTHEHIALANFEKVSDEASAIAESIGRQGRAGGNPTEMVMLLKAWQVARHAARNSHERLLSAVHANFRREPRRIA